MERATTILVADQLELVCTGLRDLFGPDPSLEIIGYADSGLAVLEFLEQNQVDIVLLDVSLPGKDGIDTTREVHVKYPKQILIAHSLLLEIEYVNSMLIEGASGYILKGAELEEFQLAFKTILAGGEYISEAAQEERDKGYAYTDKRFDGEYMGLKMREREIIKCIAREMTNKEIADHLCLSVETIRSYRKSLMSKLNVKSAAGLVKYAIDRRWV